LTAGFIFEFGHGALKINSKQTGYLESPNLEVKRERNSINLYKNQRRSYSTRRHVQSPKTLATKQRSSEKDFWKKVNSSNILDNENPFIIVNKYLKEHPNNGLSQNHIDLKLISSILSRHLNNFDLTQEEFDILIKITPVRLELPIKDKDALVKLVGKYVRGYVTIKKDDT
jgi:hypothetical protein